MENIKILKFGKNTFYQYKIQVKGNEDITYEQARRKMTRNMLLAHKFNSTGHTAQLYQYGSLKFLVKSNEIVWLKNYCGMVEGWKLDKRKYLKINKQLHIDEDVTMADLIKKDLKYKIKHSFKAVKRKLQAG